MLEDETTVPEVESALVPTLAELNRDLHRYISLLSHSFLLEYEASISKASWNTEESMLQVWLFATSSESKHVRDKNFWYNEAEGFASYLRVKLDKDIILTIEIKTKETRSTS